MPNCILTEQQVHEAFLAAPPLISQTINDLSIQHPNWGEDLYEVEQFPHGNGTEMSQIIMRGSMPQIERGFEQWKKLANNTGCEPCPGPDCSYNWTTWGGHGFERKVMSLMTRDFRSPSYCVKEIQTTMDYEQIIGKIIELLYKQVSFYKAMNIGLNVLTGLAKKYVVDSGGPKPNIANPYVYPNIGNARLSMLNVIMLEFFYEWMRNDMSCIPYTFIDSAPVYAIECSAQLLSHMYRDDPTARRDVNFSSLADGLVKKYNFNKTVKDMFLPAPIPLPRRFKIVNGVPFEILPYVNDLPMEVGNYTGNNPEYMLATHEEVLIHGKNPFKIFTLSTVKSLGGATDFGPEPSLFEEWQWINPPTETDPFRRNGYFANSATIGVSQQYSEGVYAILVERPSVRSTAMFFPEIACPPEAIVCDNEIPSTGCPCPLILSVQPNPVTPNRYFVQFATPVSANAEDSIQLGLQSGGYVTGTVISVSADGYSVEISLPASTPATVCTQFTTVYCDDTLGCSSEVLSISCCRTGATGYVDIVLKHPVKAISNGDVIVATMGDGSTQHLSVVSVDMMTNTWTVEYAAGYGPTDDPDGNGGTNLEDDLCCDRQGILLVCVPPSTDATCPACGGPVITQCQS